MACINLMRPMLLHVGQDGIDTCSVNITGTCLVIASVCRRRTSLVHALVCQDVMWEQKNYQ